MGEGEGLAQPQGFAQPQGGGGGGAVTTHASGSGHAVSGTWHLIRSNAYCSQHLRKSLAESGTSVWACQSMTLADPECSSVMYGDGRMCRCLRKGQVCDFQTRSAGENSVYRYEAATLAAAGGSYQVPPSP